MVKVCVGGRDRQSMMLVLNPCQAIRKLALMMVIGIGKAGNAGPTGVLGFACLRQVNMQDVSHRFRTVAVAFGGDVRVEFLGQPFVQRNCETFHMQGQTLE